MQISQLLLHDIFRNIRTGREGYSISTDKNAQRTSLGNGHCTSTRNELGSDVVDRGKDNGPDKAHARIS